jgi:rubrerythrin
MGVFDPVRGMFSENIQTFYECRDCGHSLDTHIDECPHCGSSEIVSYQL